MFATFCQPCRRPNFCTVHRVPTNVATGNPIQLSHTIVFITLSSCFRGKRFVEFLALLKIIRLFLTLKCFQNYRSGRILHGRFAMHDLE